MKKIAIISGCFVAILLTLFLTGTIDFNNQLKQSINKGNKLFEAKKYEDALGAYQQGMKTNPDDERLNYNVAQTAYCLTDYQQATQYYAKAVNDVNKYLNLGNASLKLGDSIEDANQQGQFYQQAVDVYKEGILSYPQNVELKYNYEIAKNKLDEISENLENQPNDNEDQQEQQDNQDQQNQNQESQSDESQQQDSEEQESQEQNDESQESQESQDSQQSEDEEQQNQSSESMSESEKSEQEQTDKEIAQILEMLEQQEQDSLKNNQKVKETNKEEEDDW